MRRVTVRISDELYLQLTVLAAITRKNKEDVVVEALREYIEKRKDEVKLP